MLPCNLKYVFRYYHKIQLDFEFSANFQKVLSKVLAIEAA